MKPGEHLDRARALLDHERSKTGRAAGTTIADRQAAAAEALAHAVIALVDQLASGRRR